MQFRFLGHAVPSRDRARGAGVGVVLFGVVSVGLVAVPACSGGGGVHDVVHSGGSARVVVAAGGGGAVPACTGGGGVHEIVPAAVGVGA